jgi:hypothetical protein
MNQKEIDELKEKLKGGDWSFSNEREFIENLFVGRFNYFLVVFSLFLTAGFANNFANYKYLVFYFGFIILVGCWIPLFRGFYKHDRIMRLLFNDQTDHPASIIQRIMQKEGYKPFFRVSYWMGVYIPAICILFLLLIGIFVHSGCLK